MYKKKKSSISGDNDDGGIVKRSEAYHTSKIGSEFCDGVGVKHQPCYAYYYSMRMRPQMLMALLSST